MYSNPAATLVQQSLLFLLTRTISLLKDPGPPAASTVHELRKTVKRIRAGFRLIRDDIGEQFRPWNAALRQLHQQLAAVRDADACQLTIEELLPSCRPDQQAVLQRLREELDVRRSYVANALTPDVRRSLIESLETVRNGVSGWETRAPGFRPFAAPVLRMARRARRLLRSGVSRCTSEDVHTLRKTVKLRLYWLEFLNILWPRGLHFEEKLVDSLAERLGTHHDLEVLREQLHSVREDDAPGPRRELMRRIRSRQAWLARQSWRLARRVFAERPKALCRRWAELEKIWREQPESRQSRPDTAAVPQDAVPTG